MSSLFLRSLRTTCRRALSYSLRNDISWAENFEEFKWHGNGSASDFKVTWNPTWCLPVAGFLTLSSLSLMDPAICASNEDMMKEKDNIESQRSTKRKPKVIFVLGGPGSGKGTQCTKITDSYGFTHLSAGDLLRNEIKSGSQYGTMIANTIKEGKIVPSEVTVRLLQNAMQDSGNDKFLIDGFPRNDENRAAFERVTGIEPEFVLFFDCSEKEMERRLLNRNQGRADDNIDTIKKRFRVFIESSLPVVQHYEKRGKVRKIDANKEVEDVFLSLQHLFIPFIEEDLIASTKELLLCIESGDYDVYKKLCDPALTAFEPEAQGHLVEGLEFHKFYFDAKKHTSNSDNMICSNISSPKVTLLGNDVGLVTYTRLRQSINGRNASVEACNETRIWQRRKDDQGVCVWKHVHFHRSKAPA